MKAETRASLEKAARLLDAARRDPAANDPENAIARAYYAAFHAATAALTEADLQARTHKGTHQLFREAYVASGRIGSHHSRAFARLFQNRHEADYLIGRVFSLSDATDATRYEPRRSLKPWKPS